MNIVDHVSVEVRYYSDPACTWSWAAETALRRLMFEFDGELSFVWAMGGLARHFGSAYRDSEAQVGSGPDCFADLMSHWLNVAGRTGMPCDPRLWTEMPISSTFPSAVFIGEPGSQFSSLSDDFCELHSSGAATGGLRGRSRR
jgi:putative protein-disulfide isomerase